jgi:hypothetical protein
MPLGLGLMMGLGHNVAASGGGAAATTWNGVTSSSDWVLSNGNLTATRPAGSGDKMVLGSAFKTAGSFTVTITGKPGNHRVARDGILVLFDEAPDHASFEPPRSVDFRQGSVGRSFGHQDSKATAAISSAGSVTP